MKNLLLNLVLAFAACAAFAGGKDDSGNDLTRSTLFGRVDGDLTTVGDIADFAQSADYLKRNSTNAVTEAFSLYDDDGDIFSRSQTWDLWFFNGLASYSLSLMADSGTTPIWQRMRLNAPAIYDKITNLTAAVKQKADGSLYDEKLQINWKLVTYDGNLYYVATTNVTDESNGEVD